MLNKGVCSYFLSDLQILNCFLIGTSSVGGAASVESYTIEKLTSSLNIDRRRFIFMALLLGCDFCPAGITGLGKETVRQLLGVWPLRYYTLKLMIVIGLNLRHYVYYLCTYYRWDPIRILYMWIQQNFEETPVSRLQKASTDKKNQLSKHKR